MRTNTGVRGFTLVEIIIVVAIIAIAAVIAVPAVQAGRHQREVRKTLQHFVGAIREASAKAVLRRRTVELWVSPDETAYALAMPMERRAADDSSYRESDDLEREEQRTIIGRTSLPASASFGEIRGGRYLEREVIAFSFFPTGGSSGGRVEFVFANGTSRSSYVISFEPLLTSIELEEGDS